MFVSANAFTADGADAPASSLAHGRHGGAASSSMTQSQSYTHAAPQASVGGGFAGGRTAPSVGGHDLFGSTPSGHPSVPDADLSSADGSGAALDRARALTHARNKERMGMAMAGPTPSASASSLSMGLGTAAPGASFRNLSRGAPMTSAPRALGESSASGGSFALGATSARGITSTGSLSLGSTSLGPSTPSRGGDAGGLGTPSAAASLADAIRERERRAREGASTPERAPETALERELAAKGISSTFDPTAGSAPSGTVSGVRAAAAAAATTLPPSSAVVDEDEGGPAGKDGLMPVAPLLGGPVVSSGPRGGPSAAVLLETMDIRSFCLTSTPRSAGVVQCYIERERLGLLGRMYPTYCLYLRDGDRFLAASQKRSNNKTSNYLFSLDKRDMGRDSASFIGKLRANFVGTEFVCYDDGIAPEKRAESGSLRQELCVMTYASNVLGSRGPRKMKVAVPKIGTDGRRIVFQPEREEDSMLSKFRAGYVQDMVTLINKPPKWNDQVGAYVLNFNGRVTMASVKNFQLVSAEDQETVLLQFGRTGKDTFTMDYQWPLCPLQAFAICMSSFDYKLACE